MGEEARGKIGEQINEKWALWMMTDQLKEMGGRDLTCIGYVVVFLFDRQNLLIIYSLEISGYQNIYMYLL